MADAHQSGWLLDRLSLGSVLYTSQPLYSPPTATAPCSGTETERGHPGAPVVRALEDCSGGLVWLSVLRSGQRVQVGSPLSKNGPRLWERRLASDQPLVGGWVPSPGGPRSQDVGNGERWTRVGRLASACLRVSAARDAATGNGDPRGSNGDKWRRVPLPVAARVAWLVGPCPVPDR